MEQNLWEKLTPEQKKKQLYLNQRRLLNTFLKSGAISAFQYKKSLGDLTRKMGYSEAEELSEKDSE